MARRSSQEQEQCCSKQTDILDYIWQVRITTAVKIVIIVFMNRYTTLKCHNYVYMSEHLASFQIRAYTGYLGYCRFSTAFPNYAAKPSPYGLLYRLGLQMMPQ